MIIQYILYDPVIKKEEVWELIKGNKEFSDQLTDDPVKLLPSRHLKGVLVRLMPLHKDN